MSPRLNARALVQTRDARRLSAKRALLTMSSGCSTPVTARVILMMIRARVTPSETASVCAPAAALSILKSSRTMQALTPGVSLKVSANRVLVYLRANRCGKICLAACPLAPVEVPWTMCTRFGRRVTPVRETRLTRVLVDSLRVMKQQFNYFIRRVSFAAPLG